MASACFLVLLTTLLTPIAILASWKSIHGRVKGIFLRAADAGSGRDRRVSLARPFSLLRFLGSDADPDVFPDRHLGTRGRIYAAVKFVLYTMLGSILMLVGILWLYNATGTFDLPVIQSLLQSGRVIFSQTHRAASLRFILPGVCDQGSALPVPHLAAGRAHGSAHRRLDHAGGSAAEDRHVRHAAILPAAFREHRAHGSRLTSRCSRSSESSTARWSRMVQTDLKRLVAYSSVSHLGFVVLGIFALTPIAMQGCALPDAESRNLHRRAVPAGGNA